MQQNTQFLLNSWMDILYCTALLIFIDLMVVLVRHIKIKNNKRIKNHRLSVIIINIINHNLCTQTQPPKLQRWTLTMLSLVHWSVSLLDFAPLLLSEKCLSRIVMRAMNSATCQHLTLAASTKLAAVWPASRNRPAVTCALSTGLHWPLQRLHLLPPHKLTARWIRFPAHSTVKALCQILHKGELLKT